MAKETKAKENTNTTKSVAEGKKVTNTDLDKQIKNAAKVLGESKKVDVFIPEYLKKRLGANYPVGINGAVIHVPVGKKVQIPEPLANVLNDALGRLKL